MTIALAAIAGGWFLVLYGIGRWQRGRHRTPEQTIHMTAKRHAEFLDDERH